VRAAESACAAQKNADELVADERISLSLWQACCHLAEGSMNFQSTITQKDNPAFAGFGQGNLDGNDPIEWRLFAGQSRTLELVSHTVSRLRGAA
jgi:hypothetical protein